MRSHASGANAASVAGAPAELVTTLYPTPSVSPTPATETTLMNVRRDTPPESTAGSVSACSVTPR